MTMQDTGPMLKKYYDTLEEIKALRKKADMMKQELIGIIEFTGATSIPDPTFECKLGQTNTYDKLQWNNLVNSEVVEILPDDCWLWHGAINVRTDQPQFPWRRTGISSSTQHHPQRVAMWFSWGDLGFTGVKTTCGNKYCCKPSWCH